MSDISSLVENCLDLGRLYFLPVFTCATIAWLDQQISPGSKYIVLLELTTTICKKLGLCDELLHSDPLPARLIHSISVFFSFLPAWASL